MTQSSRYKSNYLFGFMNDNNNSNHFTLAQELSELKRVLWLSVYPVKQEVPCHFFLK